MEKYTVVKVFDLAIAPPELQAAEELQVLRRGDDAEDEPMLKVWVGKRTTMIEPPTGQLEPVTVSAWEYFLHGWLSEAGAVAGDTVLLTWTTPLLASEAGAAHN